MSGRVALTFDDGPDVRGTAAVLDALREADARATFFVLGERVEAEPELLRAIVGAGHVVGVHGHEHLRHPRVPQSAVANDLARARDVLAGEDVAATSWRIPWGDLAGFTPMLAAAARLRLVGWTLDTHDWRGDTAAQMLAATEPELRDGAIVLLHDGVGPGARREDASATAELVGPLVAAIRARGLEPAVIDDEWRHPLPVGNPALDRIRFTGRP